MILAVETFIAYLLSQSAIADVVGQRVAIKHRYGDGWAKSDPSIVIKPDGGAPDNGVPLQEARLQVRIYAPKVHQALQIHGALIDLIRTVRREPVAVTGGTAVLQSVVQEWLPISLWDPDIDLDFVLIFLRVFVPEIPA